MKAESKPIELDGRGVTEAGTFKCSECGSTLKSFHDWIMGDDNILCASCYQSMLFPHNDRIGTEVLE